MQKTKKRLFKSFFLLQKYYCQNPIKNCIQQHANIATDKAVMGSLWPWSYGSWIYNYLCNQFESRLGRGVIQFVSDLRQVGGFLWVLRFPSPINLTATI